ncbi:MAG TPA: hypothetical protein VGL83_16125 [Stellaceae bacterium]|jgi:photosystem II stability/assembly factor-like uncharacterized protein
MIACLSPNGQNLNRSDAAPTRLLVATLRGINVLERPKAGAAWTDHGRMLDGHHCSSIMIEPRRGGIFAGMHSGGLYFSSDGGKSWEKRSNGITIDQVFCVGYAHHRDTVALYAGTEPASIFRSDDYGESWVEQPGVKETEGRDKWSFPSPPHAAHVKTMTIDSRDPNVIYAGVEQGDLLKTTDGGATWRVLDDYSKPSDWTYRDIHLVVVHPENSAELYMTTGMGLYRSRDAGKTWTLIVDNGFAIGYPDHLIISPRDGNTMFMAGAGENPGTWRASKSAKATIAKSLDRGVTWSDSSKGLPADRRANIEAMSMAAYPSGFTLFAGDTDGVVYASDDGADSWTRIAGGLAPITKGNHYRALQSA